MSEEINLTTDDAMEDYDQEIIMDEIETEDLEDSVKTEETVEVIEVEPIEEINIELDEAIGWVGGDSTRHYSLYGRDEPNQHPITAITGLREELNDIEALDVVYSNEKNHADYYLWEDENILQENRIGYFVSACSDINKIKKCTVDDDILGVTVDSAGFIGAQDNIARDIKYGLVVTTGVVHVRCESSVNVGDYVVSNDYGYAKSNKDGYKVVGRHQIDGVEYAEITLVTPVERICKLSDNVDSLNERVDDAEVNIASAMNVANAAYNKANDANNISEDAVKNALAALGKANDVSDKVSITEQNLLNINSLAVEARMIAENVDVTAKSIRDEAVRTANDSLTEAYKTQGKLNELIGEMTPLSQWEDENGKGIVGFVARANADSVTLASLAEWKDSGGDNQSIAGTIAKVNEHEAILNHVTSHQGMKSSTIAQIEQKADDNGASITSLVSSVDKYSVGKYSQAYGLTREQAASILKPGYIYIPTQHGNSDSHDEIMWENSEEKEKGDKGKKEVNEFTAKDYYVWGINDQGNADWIEHSEGSVWISNAIPANLDGALKYWYIDSNEAPDGYEAYALYKYDNKEWTKVNILGGNVNNRLVSMIQQETNKIALELGGAQDNIAIHKQWLEENSANIQDVVSWKSDLDTQDASNIATIKQTAEAAGSSVAQMAASLGKYTTIDGVWDEVDKDINETYYTTEDKMYWYYKDGRWNSVDNATGAGLVINAASIITAINNDTSQITLSANRISFNGPVAANNHFAITKDGDNVLYLDTGGNIRMAGYIMPPEQSDESEEVYIGVGRPITTTADGLAVYSTNYVNRFPNDGILNDGIVLDDTNSHIAPFLSVFQECISNDEGDHYSTSIMSTQDIMFSVAPLENSLEGSNATAYSQTPLVLTFDGGVMSGEWDFAQDQFFTKLIGSNTAFVLQPDKYNNSTRYASFYRYSTGEICLKSDQSTDLLLNVGSSTKMRCNSSGGVLYGDWSFASNAIKNYSGGNLYLYVDSKIRLCCNNSGGYMYGNWYICNDSIRVVDVNVTDRQISMHGSLSCSNIYGTTLLEINSLGGNLYETWKLKGSPIATSSDRNKKNSIADLDDRYNVLFDNLSPIRYKYNNGTSDRYHTGFIAQDVEQAIVNSNLDTLDFAGYIKDEDNVCYLRYEEFISLNTQQIQKAKKRIAELENKVAELEALIKGE